MPARQRGRVAARLRLAARSVRQERFAAGAYSIGLALALLAPARARRARAPRGARGGERRERDVAGDRRGLSPPARRSGAERRAPPDSARRRRRAALARARADRPRRATPRACAIRSRASCARTIRDGRIRILVTTKGVPLRVEDDRARACRWTERRTAAVDAELARAVLAARGPRGNRGRRQPLLPLEPAVRRVAQPLPGCAAALSRGAHHRLSGRAGSEDGRAARRRRAARARGGARLGRHLGDRREPAPVDRLPRRATSRCCAPRPRRSGALGAALLHDTAPEFVAGVDAIAGYASWGSNDANHLARAVLRRDRGPPGSGPLRAALDRGHDRLHRRAHVHARCPSPTASRSSPT